MRHVRGCFVLAAVVVALLAFGSAAQGSPLVRIVQQACVNGKCERKWSCGTVIGRDKSTRKLIVLTDASGNHDAPYLVEVEPGQPFDTGALVAADNPADAAILLVDHQARTKYLPLEKAVKKTTLAARVQRMLQSLGTSAPPPPVAQDLASPNAAPPPNDPAPAPPLPPVDYDRIKALVESAKGTPPDLRGIVREELATAHANLPAEIAKKIKLPMAVEPLDPKAVADDVATKLANKAQAHLPTLLQQLVEIFPTAAPIIQAAAPALGLGEIATGVGAPLGIALLISHWLTSRALNRLAAKTASAPMATNAHSGDTNSPNPSPPSPPAPPAGSASQETPAINVIQSNPPAINMPDDGRYNDLLQALQAEVQTAPQLVDRIFNSFRLFQQGRAVKAAKGQQSA